MPVIQKHLTAEQAMEWLASLDPDQEVTVSFDETSKTAAGKPETVGDMLERIRHEAGFEGFDLDPYLPEREIGREPPEFK